MASRKMGLQNAKAQPSNSKTEFSQRSLDDGIINEPEDDTNKKYYSSVTISQVK